MLFSLRIQANLSRDTAFAALSDEVAIQDLSAMLILLSVQQQTYQHRLQMDLSCTRMMKKKYHPIMIFNNVLWTVWNQYSLFASQKHDFGSCHGINPSFTACRRIALQMVQSYSRIAYAVPVQLRKPNSSKHV